MTIQSSSSYTALELFKILINQNKMILLDVRNKEDSKRINIESPFPFKFKNIPYFDFIENEKMTVEKIPRGIPIKIICAKEGSANFVADILIKYGFDDVAYLSGGINTWGNLLIPKRINLKSDPYKLYQFIRPGKASCSYGLIYNGKMVLFDPSRNYNFYNSFSKVNNAKIIRIYETHLQADYISGSKIIADYTGAKIYAHENDFKKSSFNYNQLKNNEIYYIDKNGPKISTIYTPGHTLGSVSYIIDKKYLLSGDTLFISSIGRPDLGGKIKSWSKILYNTITDTIQKLDNNLYVLPGHYTDWSEANNKMILIKKLADIKKQNANIFELSSHKKFFQFLNNNISEQPKVYKKIRYINKGLLKINNDEADIIDLGKNECSIAS